MATNVSTEHATTQPPVDSITDKIIEILKQELDEKNKQIAALTETVKTQAISINTAQALHAGTMQQQLTNSTDTDELSTDESTEPPPKRGFFGLFNKKSK
jgi:hypothetical protein